MKRIGTHIENGVITVVDDGPSPGVKQLPWSERLLLKIRLAVPGDGRKKVKTLIRTADAWLKDGYHEAARRLYVVPPVSAKLPKRAVPSPRAGAACVW